MFLERMKSFRFDMKGGQGMDRVKVRERAKDMYNNMMVL